MIPSVKHSPNKNKDLTFIPRALVISWALRHVLVISEMVRQEVGTGETLEAYNSTRVAYLVKFQREILSYQKAEDIRGYPLNSTCMCKHKFALCYTHLCMHINIYKHV